MLALLQAQLIFRASVLNGSTPAFGRCPAAHKSAAAAVTALLLN